MPRLYLSTPSELYDLYQDLLDCYIWDDNSATCYQSNLLRVLDEIELRSVWAE